MRSMQIPRRRRRTPLLSLALAALLVVALLAVAAGCGEDEGDGGAGGPSPTTTGSPGAFDLDAIQTDPALTDMLPEGMTEIRVASDIPYPPWEFFDPPNSSDPAGFDYDLSQALGKKIGVPVSFNDVPFDGIILNIKGGRNDMIMSAMYDNAERQAEGISFVDYAYDGTSILTLKGNPEGLTNLDSLAGKTVACQQGTTQQALLQRLNRQFREEGMEPMNVLTLPDQPAALLAVSSGRAVADVTDHSTAAYIAQTTNDGNTFEVIEDPEAPQGYEPAIIGIGIVEENQELIDTVQQALQALIDDGVYQQLIESYGLLPVESAEVNLGGQTPLPLPSE
jgi:polar amino acid transport system substrate-binding protein